VIGVLPTPQLRTTACLTVPRAEVTRRTHSAHCLRAGRKLVVLGGVVISDGERASLM
jgi:hypothetical protein